MQFRVKICIITLVLTSHIWDINLKVLASSSVIKYFSLFYDLHQFLFIERLILLFSIHDA